MEVPPDWVHGELLDVKNFGSHFTVGPITERMNPDGIQHPWVTLPPLRFESAYDVQNFVGLWYARAYQ